MAHWFFFLGVAALALIVGELARWLAS